MYVGRRYPLMQTLHWSRMDWSIPLGWSTLVTVLYQAGVQILAIPFSTVISWVFLSADRIGDWSENPL